MKIVRKLFSVLLLVVGFFATTVSAESTAPSSFTISASKTSMLYGYNILGNGSTLNFTYKVNNDGQIVYCTEIHDTMTNSTETYTFLKEASADIAYVLANGYPNKSITGDKNKDYYITGLAVWYLISPNDNTFYYFDLSAGTYKGAKSQIVYEINKLVTGAKGASYTKPTLKLNNPSTNLSLSVDGKYYLSKAMNVTASGVSKYVVNLSEAPTGTVVVDLNGNSKNEFSVSESFIVKVPVDSITGTKTSLSVNVSAVGSINKAYIYAPTVASHQNLVTLYPEKVNLNANTSLSLTSKTKVTISKLDIANDEELPGAHLVIKDKDGNIVAEWDSTNEAKVIEGLPFGSYTLTETIAPEGYAISEETITFTLSADKIEASAVMYNSAIEVTKVIISKQDITNSKELPGAHLVVKDKDGNIIDEWVSGDKPHEIEGLEPGKTYILSETLQPNGYILKEESIEFVVKDDGTVTNVVMYNSPAEIIEEVPKTSSFKTITYSLIGMLVIGLGSLLVFRNVKKIEI